MLNRFSSNALLKSIISVMAATVVLLLALGAWSSWQRLATTNRILAAAEASNHAFRAMHTLRVDRASTFRGVNAAVPLDANGKAYLQKIRDVETPSLKTAMELLETIDFPERATLLPNLKRSVKTVLALQEESWAAMQKPKADRRAALGQEYMTEATTLLEQLEKLLSNLTLAVKYADPFVDQMLSLKQLAWLLRNTGGDASVMISNGLSGQPIPPDFVMKYNTNLAKAEAAWTAILDMANGGTLPARVNTAIAGAKNGFFSAEHTEQRMKMIKLLAAGEPTGMTAGDWVPIAVGKLDTLLAVAEASLESAKEYAQEQRSAAQTGLIVGALLLTLALAVAIGSILLVSRRVMGPLLVIQKAMVRVAGGDLNAEVRFTDRQDEIGALAGALGTFKQNAVEKARIEDEQRTRHAQAEQRQKAIEAHIKSFEGQMRDALTALDGASKQMRTTSEGMSDTAGKTNTQVKSVASASEEASSNVQTVAAASEELSASIAEISRQVSHAATIAGRAVDETKQTDGTVQGLAEAATRIGEVVKMINDIAGQTNLLALNATIEAARAGEAGKGFAVVASEVKSLANQTAKATEDISAQINAIQNVTKDAVEAIKRIGGTIGEVSSVATSIASAVEEQGAATQEITRNTQQAAQRTKDVQSHIDGVTSGANATGSAAQGVKTAAEELSRQSEKLRAEVNDFLTKIRAA